MYLYSLFRRHRIIIVLDDHVFQLTVHVTTDRFRIRSRHRHSDHKIRIEILFHDIDREVVVYSAVIHENSIYLNGAENERETHRRSYRFAERAFAEDNLVLVIYIGGHTSERHKKPVEVLATLLGVRTIQSQELDVHRQRTDKACGYDLIGQRLFLSEIHIYRHPLRRRCRFIVVVNVFLVDGSCGPVKKIGRGEEIKHFFGRPSAGIQTSDNGTHRCACHTVYWDTVIFKSLYDTYMSYPFRSTSAQHETDTAT